VVGVVHRRAQQVRHPGVDADDALVRRWLHGVDARQEDARVGDDVPPGLDREIDTRRERRDRLPRRLGDRR